MNFCAAGLSHLSASLSQPNAVRERTATAPRSAISVSGTACSKLEHGASTTPRMPSSQFW